MTIYRRLATGMNAGSSCTQHVYMYNEALTGEVLPSCTLQALSQRSLLLLGCYFIRSPDTRYAGVRSATLWVHQSLILTVFAGQRKQCTPGRRLATLCKHKQCALADDSREHGDGLLSRVSETSLRSSKVQHGEVRPSSWHLMACTCGLNHCRVSLRVCTLLPHLFCYSHHLLDTSAAQSRH